MSTSAPPASGGAAAPAPASAGGGAKKDAAKSTTSVATIVDPGSFEIENHYYPRCLNAQRHPLVSSFMGLSNKVIAKRYCHLHPATDEEALMKLLTTPKTYFKWAGSDLFCVTDDSGKKQMIVVETNSCPSGNKSLPLNVESVDNDSNYHLLLQRSFWPAVKAFKGGPGALAVIYDKNYMEASGYAAALADVAEEPVYLATWKDTDPDPPCRIVDGGLQIRTSGPDGAEPVWIPVRAAYRYVTQKPWQRIPPVLKKTLIFNPIVCCLAGGRNKMCADKAYEFFNHKHYSDGITIRTPVTIRDVHKREVPIWVKSMGGFAVVKVPYGNAGQGVYTICSPEELRAFMDTEHHYDKFIVQSLVGNHSWSSDFKGKKYYHTGTVPSNKGATHVMDLRFMLYSTDKGFKVCSMYARRAADPLTIRAPVGTESWGQLGTNLSVKLGDNVWDTETRRLLLMDSRDFNKLGLGIDDLIDGYVQTVASVSAIDDMAVELMHKGEFDRELYSSVNSDQALLDEIAQ